MGFQKLIDQLSYFPGYLVSFLGNSTSRSALLRKQVPVKPVGKLWQSFSQVAKNVLE